MLPIKEHSILFAPLEGYTDPLFRQTIAELFPDWDLQYTDFLRIPSHQTYKPGHIKEHIGDFFNHQSDRYPRNILQILAPAHSPIEEQCHIIWSMGQSWLDFNLGCPSKKVNGHKGGSYLLQDLDLLKDVLRKMRASFPGILTAKVRTGYNDTRDFKQIISIIADAGLDAITIHARTRAQQYTGAADWSFIKQAVDLVPIPIIGNGDIWDEELALKLLDYSGCHSVMAARGALKTPWMAKRFKDRGTGQMRDNLEQRDEFLPLFLSTLIDNLRKNNVSETAQLKRLKSVSRYLFDDYPDGNHRKSELLRAQNLEEFNHFSSKYFHKIPCQN